MQCGKLLYPLAEMLLLCILTVLARAENITDIARFGEKNSICCAVFAPSRRARRPMTISAKAQSCRLRRRLSRQFGRRVIPSPDSPELHAAFALAPPDN
jgi:hypothetical protein